MTQVYFTPHEIEMAAFYAERGKPFNPMALVASIDQTRAQHQIELLDANFEIDRLQDAVEEVQSEWLLTKREILADAKAKIRELETVIHELQEG